jgi:hypothetical protein
MLLADADLQNHDHPACDEHRAVWGHLYRRAVAMPPESTADVDLRDSEGATEDATGVDLRGADEASGRPER